MLTLYVRTGCPFCAKVLRTGEELGLVFEQRDVGDPTFAAELIARGGKLLEPYLVDTDTGVELYESMDIDAYLRKTYGKQVK